MNVIPLDTTGRGRTLHYSAAMGVIFGLAAERPPRVDGTSGL
jgi:hypothetical protein